MRRKTNISGSDLSPLGVYPYILRYVLNIINLISTVLGLSALKHCISVYTESSPRQREKEKDPRIDKNIKVQAGAEWVWGKSQLNKQSYLLLQNLLIFGIGFSF